MTTTPEPHVIISLPQIYDEVRDMSKTLHRIDGTLASYVDAAASRERAQDAKLEDHEARIRADEANRWPTSHIVSITTVAGSAIALAALFITR